MIYVISAIIVLGVLIFVHELGHFLAAKAVGVRVEKFSLGFPPKMISKIVGDTEYQLSWVPLGGYVKMFGEHPGEEEEIPKELQHLSFSHKPAWARFLIVLAGPTFNFIFAILVYILIFSISGIPHIDTTISEVQKDMPAEAAGIKVNDKIIYINGEEVIYWSQVSEKIQAIKSGSATFTLLRGGREITLSIAPKVVTRKNIFGEDIQVAQVGIVASGKTLIETVSIPRSFYMGVAQTYNVGASIITVVIKLFERSIPLKTLGGPILIAQFAGQVAKTGVVAFVSFMAALSINLGILNLFPIPLLDGGHLLFFSLEMIFRRPISIKVREVAQQAGLVFFLIFMVLVFYNDLDRIFSFSKFFVK